MVNVVDGWLVTVTGVVPSVYVNVNGAEPVKVNVTSGRADPAQTVPPPLTTAVGNGATVTTAEPVMFGLGAVTEHVVAVLVTLTIVYVVVDVGVTFTVAPLLIPFALKLVVPSVYTTLNVPAERLNVSVAVPPPQMVTVPVILATGTGLTVIIALPVMFGLGAVAVQPDVVFVTLTIVYVVFALGLTFTVAPLLIPVALKLVVPSVYTTL